MTGIGDILHRNWDPLGVADDPDCEDEYDSYVGAVYRLLASDATHEEVAQHLARVEEDSLGYPDTNWRMLVPVARKLRDFYDRATSSSLADEQE